jgi:hypothetical protein
LTLFGPRWAELGRQRIAGLRRKLTRARSKKAARIVLIALGSLYLLYLLAANAVLGFGGVEWFVNSSTKDAHLELGRSHSWLPGRVEVRDVALRFEDENVQFQIVIARASAKLNLLGLARKRFHLSALEADGVRFLFRHKVTSTAGNERRLAHFPRIEGFSDPPILVPLPKTDKTKNWVIKLENVHAHGVELWFMEYRYAGNAEVSGGFELAPGRKLEVGPARANFTAGTLGVGAKRPLATNVRGSLDFRFRATNPDPIPGLEIFRQISGKFLLSGELVDLEATNLYLSDASLLAVRRGKASLDARLELSEGRLVRDSFITVRGVEDVHLAQAVSASKGRLDVEIRARSPGSEPPRLVVDARLSDVGTSLRSGAPSDPADVGVRLIHAMLATDHADVARPWKLEEASFRLEGGRIEDLRVLEAAPAEKRVLAGGAAWFFARAELSKQGAWSGAFRADTRRARLRLGERRLLFDATLAASLESPQRNLDAGALHDVVLEIASPSGDPPGERTSGDERERKRGDEPATLEASLRVPRTDWSGFPPKSARGRANLMAPHVEPLLEAVGAPPILISVWPDAPVDASARFVYEKEALDVRLDLAKSGPFRAMGRLKVCSPPKGAFLVKGGAFSVGLTLRDGAVSVVPLASDEWLVRNAPQCPGAE